jgi:hypothetical protein
MTKITTQVHTDTSVLKLTEREDMTFQELLITTATQDLTVVLTETTLIAVAMMIMIIIMGILEIVTTQIMMITTTTIMMITTLMKTNKIIKKASHREAFFWKKINYIKS